MDKLDAKTTALVVIDLQKGILASERSPYSAADVLARSVDLARAMRQAGGLVVLVHVGFAPDFGDVLKSASDEQSMPAGGLPADWSDFAPELEAGPRDVIIRKRQWGAFYGTGLEVDLRRRGIKTIVLCGIATNFGVESTARDGWERGFQIVFAEDAMTSTAPGAHEFAFKTVFPRIGRAGSTREVIEALS